MELFLDERLSYLDIFKVIDQCCEAHKNDFVLSPSLNDIVDSDLWARQFVAEAVDKKAPLAV